MFVILLKEDSLNPSTLLLWPSDWGVFLSCSTHADLPQTKRVSEDAHLLAHCFSRILLLYRISHNSEKFFATYSSVLNVGSGEAKGILFLTMQPIYNRFYLPTLFFIPVEKRKV
jgi:hypothetical protein